MTGTFHKDIGFPPLVDTLDKRLFEFTFSAHALHACLNDKYGKVMPPASIVVHKNQIIEVSIFNGEIQKVVYRTPHNEYFDLILVFMPREDKVGFVKTCWLNHKKDDHSTLDKSKYSTYVVP